MPWLLEIVQAVTQALDLLPYDTAIGPEARQTLGDYVHDATSVRNR